MPILLYVICQISYVYFLNDRKIMQIHFGSQELGIVKYEKEIVKEVILPYLLLFSSLFFNVTILGELLPP